MKTESATRRAMGAIERALILTDRPAPFNVVIVSRFVGSLDPERIRQALDHLQARHPLLTARITQKGGRVTLETGQTGPIPLEVNHRLDDKQWMNLAEVELNRRFDIATGPPIRASALLSGDPGATAGELILTLLHAVVDHRSGSALVQELLTFCDYRTELVSAPAGMKCPPPADALFPPRYRGFARARKITAFLLRQMADEAFYQLRSLGAPKPTLHKQARCKILPVRLSREATANLVRQSRVHRVSLNSALNAALLLAVGKHLYDQRSLPMRYFTFADLRSHLEPPAEDGTLAAYFSILRFTTPVKAGMNLWTLAGAINRQVHAAARRGDRFAANLLSPKMMEWTLQSGKARMGTAAVSYSGPAKFTSPSDALRLEEIHAFNSNMVLGPEYTALARLWESRLWWDIVYLDSDMDRSVATRVAEVILDLLKAAGRAS